MTNNVMTSKISLVIKCHTQYTINSGCVSIVLNVMSKTKHPLGVTSLFSLCEVALSFHGCKEVLGGTNLVKTKWISHVLKGRFKIPHFLEQGAFGCLVSRRRSLVESGAHASTGPSSPAPPFSSPEPQRFFF